MLINKNYHSPKRTRKITRDENQHAGCKKRFETGKKKSNPSTRSRTPPKDLKVLTQHRTPPKDLKVLTKTPHAPSEDLKALAQNLFFPRRKRSRESRKTEEKTKHPPQQTPEVATTANSVDSTPRTRSRATNTKQKLPWTGPEQETVVDDPPDDNACAHRENSAPKLGQPPPWIIFSSALELLETGDICR
jgi:hypothetical protein